jgi:C4-dicarboxylate-specific signal transduction histidine kinase
MNSGEDFNIKCRPGELAQVLLNLLNNSYDAVQDLPEKWVRVNLDSFGSTIDIRVTDSGPGIPAEISSKLMQSFFTTKEIGKGTGLGLSISKGIVEAHNGNIRIDNNCKNTCFVVTLPKMGSSSPLASS